MRRVVIKTAPLVTMVRLPFINWLVSDLEEDTLLLSVKAIAESVETVQSV
jgi:hypothetical protein